MMDRNANTLLILNHLTVIAPSITRPNMPKCDVYHWLAQPLDISRLPSAHLRPGHLL